MHIDIKSCNTPNFYDTYHTFMTLYLYCFDNMFLQEACSRRSKHLLKLIHFLCFSLMIGQDCCALTSQYMAKEAPDCMNIRHFMTHSIFR